MDLAYGNTYPPKRIEILYVVRKLFISKFTFLNNNLVCYLSVFFFFSIISDIVDRAILEEELEFSDNDVRNVFVSILQEQDLDIREKKSAIIDFISAGIETV